MLTEMCINKDDMSKKKVKEETVEDIKVSWLIRDGWEDLSYEDKARYYWEYRFVDGIRVFEKSDD